jgi:hypothetical protein
MMAVTKIGCKINHTVGVRVPKSDRDGDFHAFARNGNRLFSFHGILLLGRGSTQFAFPEDYSESNLALQALPWRRPEAGAASTERITGESGSTRLRLLGWSRKVHHLDLHLVYFVRGQIGFDDQRSRFPGARPDILQLRDQSQTEAGLVRQGAFPVFYREKLR